MRNSKVLLVAMESGVAKFLQVVIFCLLCVAQSRAWAEPPNVKRIVFLGDSITHAGGYIDAIETALIIQYPKLQIELLNLGCLARRLRDCQSLGMQVGLFLGQIYTNDLRVCWIRPSRIWLLPVMV